MTCVSEVLATTVALCPPLRSYPHLGGLSLSPSKFERCDFYRYVAYMLKKHPQMTTDPPGP